MKYLNLITLLFCLVLINNQTDAQIESPIVINEYSVSNLSGFTDNYNRYEDWFELYNTGDVEVDISGYYLSDDPDEPMKWALPDDVNLPAGGFIRFWATGRDIVSGNHYHTSFRLSQTKDNPEFVVFSNPYGEIIEQQQLVITQKEHSRGRITNGSDEWAIFTDPTPNSSNNASNSYSYYAPKPVVDNEAGYYTGSVTVTFEPDSMGSEIHYTLTGTEPTVSSPTYTGPITIDETSILIARAFNDDGEILPSLLEFNTYFIDITHTLAVMSASAEQLDNLLNGNQSLRPFGTFEYFNEDGERTTYGYGEFNEHGQDSWVHDQRSIDYVSRDECGYNYAIREQIIPLTDRDEFQRIILRAAGDDNYPGIDTSAHLRDFFVQNIAHKHDLNLDVRKGEKGILYANGKYWGIYGFREKVNDHDFTGYYYDQGKYDIYYLMLWGSSWAAYGGQPAWTDWDALHDFIKYNDMAVSTNWEYVKSNYDYKSLVDYIHINSFVVCSDWINWNVGWWKGTNPEGGHQKWGYVLWDEDATFNHYINYTGVPGTTPYVSPCYPEGLTSDPEQHIIALNHLRDNEEFDEYYIARYADLLNTAFHPDTMIAYLDEIEAKMLPEMPNHVDRWGGSISGWQNNVQKIRNFIETRAAYAPTGLIDCYDLTGPYEIDLEVDPPGTGKIMVNSVLYNNFPVTTQYFGNIKTTLKAVANGVNYEFDHWEIENQIVLPNADTNEIFLYVDMDDVIKAVFVEKTTNDSLIINEINYNSSNSIDPGDWVEFYNPHDAFVDISNWTFRDKLDEHAYTFPEGTYITPNGYLVLCRDSLSFHDVFPDVQNYIGEIDFGLNGGGELIRLYDAYGVLVDTVHYDDELPWPTEADGNGPTLSLIHWSLDNALPENWEASMDNGTPGAVNSTFTQLDHRFSQPNEVTFVVYPNPVTSHAVIQITSNVQMQESQLLIYNVFGKEVKRIESINSNRIELDVNGLQTGIYICKLTDSNNNILGTKKMLVE